MGHIYLVRVGEVLLVIQSAVAFATVNLTVWYMERAALVSMEILAMVITVLGIIGE